MGIRRLLRAMVAILGGLVVLAAASSANAQNSSLSAALLSPPDTSIAPGDSVVISLQARNNGASPLSVSTAAVTPDGWAYMALPETVELAPGAQEIIFISVSVPNDAPAGGYSISVSAAAPGAASVGYKVSVQVTAVEGLRLALTEEPRAMVVAGTDIGASFSLSNLGNVPANVTLVAEAGSNWTATADPSTVTVQPGATTQIKVSLAPPKDLHNLETGRVTLKAYSAAVTPEAVPAAQGNFSVQVLPSPASLSGIPMYATLEGSLRSSMNWQEGVEPSLQHAFSLGGALSPMQSVQLDASAFSLRSSGNVFNDAQRFHFRWDDLRWGYAQAGDQSVSLRSQLLAYSLSGRGVDLGLDAGPMRYHLFYSDPQNGFGSRSAGAELERNGRNGRVSLLALKQDQSAASFSTDRPAQPSTGLSLHGEYKPGKKLDVTGEAAVYDGSQTGADHAYRLTARYSGGDLTGGGDYVYAGPHFFGAWSDTEYYQADVSYSPNRKLRLWSNYNKRRGNLSRDPEQRGDDQSRWQLAGSLNIGKHMTLRVSQALDWRGDRVQLSIDEHTRRMEYELGRTWRKLKLTASWQDETRGDRLSATSEDALQFRLLGTSDVNRRARLEFECALDRDKHSAGGADDSITGRLGGEIKLGKSSDLSLDVRSTWGEAGRNSTWLQGALSRKLAPGRELDLKVQHNTGDFGGETALSAEYTIPIKMPVKQFPITGIIEGKVSLSHDATKGVSGVLVRVDQILLPSDPYAAAPESQSAEDASRIEEDRYEPSPILGLHPHERQAIEERGPRKGTYGAAQHINAQSIEARPQPHSVPGLTKAEALTDDQGRFRITGLLPGEYGLQLDTATLGVGMSATGADVQRVEVRAGQTTTVEVSVMSAASVSGMVQIQSQTEPGTETKLLPLTDAVLELSGPGDKKYRVSGPGGRFSFSELPAGHYALRVRTEGLPEYTVVEPETLEFDLAAGEAKPNLIFTVKPMEREIEITTEQS